MPQDPLLEQAIQALHDNDKKTARVLLTRLLKADNSNFHYWIWMSGSVTNTKEAIYCLQQALKCDPGNDLALRGLAIYGALKQEAPPEVNPYAVQTNWETFLKKRFIPDAPPKKSKPVKRKDPKSLLYVFAAIVAIALFTGLYSGYQWLSKPASAVEFPTLLPSQKPSATYLPTKTPIGFVPTITPTPPPSLNILLEVPYTPTPRYVQTPHNTEAYQLAMRAYEEKDWSNFKTYMLQVIDTENNPPDAYYYLAEAERAQGHNTAARRYYDQALAYDLDFAPAYLGKAINELTLDAGAVVIKDLNKAIQYDPTYGAAYLERGMYYRFHEEYEKALSDLERARDLMPDNGAVFHATALTYLDMKQYDQALSFGQQAQNLDITILENYRVMGETHIALRDPNQSLAYLSTYLEYSENQALAHTLMAKAYVELGDPVTAIDYASKAISIDSRFTDAFIQRGRAYLLQGNSTKAVGDFRSATELKGSDYEAYYYLGIALIEYGKNEDAKTALTMAYLAASSELERGQVYHYRAIAWMRFERINQARDDWELITRLPTGTLPEEWVAEAQYYLDTCEVPRCATPTPRPVRATEVLTPTVTTTSSPMP